MSNLGKCPLYRKSVNLNGDKGLGHCDLKGGQSICEGDYQYCYQPDAVREQLLGQKKKIRDNKREKDNKKKSIHYKVLVVDDQEQMRKLIATLLSKQGHQCVTASNGTEALNEVYQNKFDAVITDVVMPQMDGIALTKAVLALYPNLRIMVMTGYAKEHSAESVLTAGARDFIKKPFSIQEFILRFNKMMDDHKILV